MVGKYDCFVRGLWQEGLPKLAIANDAQLQRLAKLDIQNPESVADQTNLADGWWEAAEHAGSDQSAMKQRAGYWYRRALPNAAGLTKLKITKRLESIPSSATVQDAAHSGGTAPGAILAAARNSVENGTTSEAPAIGSLESTAFRDISAEGILIGVKLATGKFGFGYRYRAVSSLRPIYLTADGTVAGKAYGPVKSEETEIVAKPGYAVGGLRINASKGPIRVRGVQILFMKIRGDRLDPTDTYYSDPYLLVEEDAPLIKTAGAPLVGVAGSWEVQEMRGLTVIVADDDAQAVKTEPDKD